MRGRGSGSVRKTTPTAAATNKGSSIWGRWFVACGVVVCVSVLSLAWFVVIPAANSNSRGSSALAVLVVLHNEVTMSGAIRLMDELYQPGDLWLIHVPPSSDNLLAMLKDSNYGSNPKVIPVTIQKLEYATVSQVQVSLGLLRKALQMNKYWRHALLLSGDSYPLVSPSKLRETMALNPQSNYIEATKWSSKHDRVFSCHGVEEGVWPVTNATLWSGSGWWALSREAAEYTTSTSGKPQDLLDFFQCSRFVDEHYFQTLIASSPILQPTIVEPFNFMYAEVIPGTTNAAVLAPSDAVHLAQTGMWFARKVQSTDTALAIKSSRL
ncbi:beta-glucuronosyltransferase [Pelomyxa schiedti]|nr:beta-glucuronosyltransferase [Pelomyxa schiedti]